MKISIRRGVFETNSSSTHTLTMCTETEFDLFKKGKLFYNRWDDKLFNVEEVVEYLGRYEDTRKRCKDFFEASKEEQKKALLECATFKDEEGCEEDLEDSDLSDVAKLIFEEFDGAFETYESWGNNIYLERFEQEYITPSGEKIIAFGMYGYEG